MYLDEFHIGSGADPSQSDSVLLSTGHILSAATTIMTDEDHLWMTFKTGSKYRQRGFKLEVMVTSLNGKKKPPNLGRMV